MPGCGAAAASPADTGHGGTCVCLSCRATTPVLGHLSVPLCALGGQGVEQRRLPGSQKGLHSSQGMLVASPSTRPLVHVAAPCQSRAGRASSRTAPGALPPLPALWLGCAGATELLLYKVRQGLPGCRLV